MQGYIVNRPDEETLERILSENVNNAVGVILRLAWKAGLLRDEIQHLTWAQIDFAGRQIMLPDRSVPISEELCIWLAVLREERNRRSEMVVLSDRDKKPLTPQSISRLARAALDHEGQSHVRLIDLRHDFILRQLEEHDWQYVSRITGVEPAALNVHFAEYLKDKKVSTRIRREEPVQIDEFALWKLLQAERTSPAGVTLRLTAQMGMRLEEITALRWEQIDLKNEVIRLSGGRTRPITSEMLGILKQMRETADSEFVLTAPRSKKPFDRTRLSKMARTTLVKGGMDNVTLRDLRMDCENRSGGESQILAWVREHGAITRNRTAELLGVTHAAAYSRLKQMVRRGRLTQVGARYYLFGTVIPPEEQAETVLQYLKEEGFAYRQDIARLLHIDPSQCRPILKRMADEGLIVQERQKYTLKKQ